MIPGHSPIIQTNLFTFSIRFSKSLGNRHFWLISEWCNRLTLIINSNILPQALIEYWIYCCDDLIRWCHHSQQVPNRKRTSTRPWLNGRSTLVWSSAMQLPRTPTTLSLNMERGKNFPRLSIECGGNFTRTSFQWRHNECDGVSNHQPHDCLLKRLFRRRSKKTSKFSGLCHWQ